MEESIGVSKAARMIGIDRSELRERLHLAGIETFEGKVALEAVQRIAPSLNYMESEIAERLRAIRDNAIHHCVNKDSQPNTPDPQRRIQQLERELMVERAATRRYRAVIDDISAALGQLQHAETECEQDIGYRLCGWLKTRLES